MSSIEMLPLAVIIVAWWVASSGSSSLYFPPLSEILEAFRGLWLFSHVQSDVVPSLTNLAAGFIIASLVGVMIGFVLGLTPMLWRVTLPIVEFFRAVPAVTVLPILLLLFGLTPETRVSVVVYGCLWPVLLNTIDGVRSVDPLVKDVARSYQVSRSVWLSRIVLPAAAPQIVAGMRTALSLGITLIILSELIGATNGIGYTILQAQRRFEPTELWAGILLLGLLGYLSNVAFRVVESRLLRWHHTMHAGTR